MRIGVLALLASAIWSCVVGVHAEARTSSAPPGLTLVGEVALSDRLHELTFTSPALRRDVRTQVLLPSGYADDGRYPVLYLLHGAGDDESTWTTFSDVEAATEGLALIVVMPEAGRTPQPGWYSDWVNGPAWESFHIGELLPYIDHRYATMGTAAGRGVAGKSMGGFGAMSYAARHPDLFHVAASFSGNLDARYGGVVGGTFAEHTSPITGGASTDVWGPYATQEVNWRAHNPLDLVTNLRGKVLWVSYGNGVPASDDELAPTLSEQLSRDVGRRFHEALLAAGITHYWFERPGVHHMRYWQQDLHNFLPIAMEAFAAPAAAPEPFDLDTADTTTDVYDWNFVVDRPAREFLQLRSVSSSGLRVRGSGRLVVTTGPRFAPGRCYRTLVRTTGGPDRVEVVRAGVDGRLRIDVDLGPGHRDQQFTAAGGVAEVVGGSSYWVEADIRISPV